MKAFYLCTLILCVASVIGCQEPADNSLATDGYSADAIAAYETQLQAVSGDDSYEDADDDEAEEEKPAE